MKLNLHFQMVSHYQYEEQYQADCPPVHWRHVLRQAAAARGVRLPGRPGAGAGGPPLLHPHHGGHTGAGRDGGQLRLGQVKRDHTNSYYCHVFSGPSGESPSPLNIQT